MGHGDQHGLGFGVGEAQGRGGETQGRVVRAGELPKLHGGDDGVARLGSDGVVGRRRRPWASSSTPAPTWAPQIFLKFSAQAL